jgi:hypothetical protein
MSGGIPGDVEGMWTTQSGKPVTQSRSLRERERTERLVKEFKELWNSSRNRHREHEFRLDRRQ